MDDTSLSLLERLQHHPSESAWRDVVELYTPLLDDWLTRFKLQRADREDLVQESLTTVLQHLGSFRHHGQGELPGLAACGGGQSGARVLAPPGPASSGDGRQRFR